MVGAAVATMVATWGTVDFQHKKFNKYLETKISSIFG
jgi:hypothetical protein